jgi:hypothetical protein
MTVIVYVFRSHRKRKFKRMAVDAVELDNPSTSHATVPVMPLPSGKKKRVVKHSPNCENKWAEFIFIELQVIMATTHI